MPRLLAPLRASIGVLRAALGNDGIRRLELIWCLGIAADAALLVVLLVEVYARDGVVAAGILGAVRMGPAVAAGILSGTVVRRFGGRRLLVALGVTRAVAAALIAVVIAADLPTLPLYVLATVCAVAGAPIWPAAATLMPGLARSPGELVAANMAWGMGEGFGMFTGPFVAGVLIAAGQPGLAIVAATAAFALTVLIASGLRFEHAMDASGGSQRDQESGFLEGVRALNRRRLLRWTMLGVYGQVLTRGVLNALLVVASIELLSMGDGGVGLLSAALGLGGFVGAILAMSATLPHRLILTQSVALAYWGAPVAVIGMFGHPVIALAAMVVIGIANAVYDVSIITTFQRGATNQERAGVFSLFEAVVAMGLVTGSLLAPLLLAAFGAQGALAVTGALLPVLALVIYGAIGREDKVTVVDEEVTQLVRKVEVFEELPLTAVERLASGMTPLAVPAGHVLMREGDPGDTFVIVGSGEVEVSVEGRVVNRLGPGTGFGEIALLRRSRRTATVTALTDVTGYEVDASTFACAVSGPASAAVSERIAASNLRRGAAQLPSPEPTAAAGG